jgi:hypothetical protein
MKSYLTAWNFDVMEARRDQIDDSYPDTSKWIFEDPKSTDRPWSNFTTWLEDPNSSLYWINGKAGSGKSTLMSFLENHKTTKKLLKSWSGNIPLVTVSFFFWNSGKNPFQKDQKGLFCSVFHQILKSNPSLIPVAFPDYGDTDFSRLAWNINELKSALRNICSQDIVEVKLFLFIDGLDGFIGDHLSLATFFRDLSKSPSVKVCVSSRPIAPFDEAFLGFPTLRLKFPTFDDIKLYVDAEVGENELLHALRNREGSNQVDPILFEIVERAKGA